MLQQMAFFFLFYGWVVSHCIYVPHLLCVFPCGSAGKESACNVGDLGPITGLGRPPGEEKGYPLQHSGLENSMDCIVHGVTKSRTWLSNFHFQFHVHWVSDAIQPSHPVILFSSCLQSFPESGSLLMSQFFTLGGQSIGVSASAPVLPVNVQGWFSLGLTGLISLLSKELSRVFSSIIFWRHQFLSTQSFLSSSSHIHAQLLKKA